ncbi:MAG TPA: putative LPS assembly protein LptD [Candidatus Krumholzibacteria bacterium]|nr:putative LPS assembly protein LptD [Candidatus Krumholzibacteria bacterium]
MFGLVGSRAAPRQVSLPDSPGSRSMHAPWRLAAGFPLLLLALVAGRAAAQTAPERFDLRGALMQYDTRSNVATFIDSVILRYSGVTVESQQAQRYGTSNDYHVQFQGDVRIRDRGVIMHGDQGEFRQRDNSAELRGRVTIQDSTGLIRAKRVRYYRDQRLLWLWGDVVFEDEASIVQADSVRYEEDRGFGEAFGNVVLIDRKRNSQARGPHGFYDRASGNAWLDQKPELVLRDEEGIETFVHAEENFRDAEKGLGYLRGGVRIVRDSTVAEADSAIFHEANNLFELRGHPRVRRGGTRISGQEIDVHFGGEVVEQVRVRQRALLVQSRRDTLLLPDPNQVSGDSAVIDFDQGKLRRAIVSGNGSSNFVPVEATPNRISLNEAQSDSIVMLFNDDELQEVLFIGNASGVYRYHDGDFATHRPRGAAVPVDSVFGVVRADTTAFDFRRQANTVEYSGERILYLAPFNDLHIQGSAQVMYQGRTLKAGDITFDADTDLLTARKSPVLVEGDQRVYGDQMGYDMHERQAFVTEGATVYDQGYYRGTRILRDPDGTLQVAKGRYTSCDLETPHYDFRSDQMKIYLRDKAVARPVYLYLGNLPIFYLPFFFNSVDPGRKSGFLMPDIEIGVGSSSRYIRGLNYYWAASNYWDVMFSSAYNERSRVDRTSVEEVLSSTGQSRNIQLGANLRYLLRYRLNGNVEYRRSDDIDTDASFVTMRGSHRQTLSDRMTLNGTLDFASSDQAVRATNEFTDYDRSRQRQLTSSLTFSRGGRLARTNVSLQRRQILEPGDDFVGQSILSQTLPSLSLSFPLIRLAPRPGPGGPGWQRFLSDLQFNPNLSVTRRVDDVRQRQWIDASTGMVVADTTGVDSVQATFFTERLQRLDAATGAALGRQSSLWILTVNPSVSYAVSYADDDRNPVPRSDRFTQSLRAGLTASTRLYGIFHPRIGSLRALRHTIEPTASYAYTAALSGVTANQGVTLGLRNSLDAKVEKDSTEKRVDGVFEWALSTGYDPDRERRWGNIGSNLTFNRHGPLRLTVSQTIDPYRRKIISTSIPFTFRLAGSFGGDEADAAAGKLNRIAQEEGSITAPEDSIGPAQNWGFSPEPEDGLETVERSRDVVPGEKLNWELAFSYSFNHTDGRNLSRNVGVGAAIKPTAKWTVRWRANFDTDQREWINPSVDIERDLHCWRASFSRIFNAYDDEWRYYFRIFVIRHQDELFLESGERSFGY